MVWIDRDGRCVYDRTGDLQYVVSARYRVVLATETTERVNERGTDNENIDGHGMRACVCSLKGRR